MEGRRWARGPRDEKNSGKGKERGLGYSLAAFAALSLRASRDLRRAALFFLIRPLVTARSRSRVAIITAPSASLISLEEICVSAFFTEVRNDERTDRLITRLRSCFRTAFLAERL